ncbi:hypothetical protein KJ855_02385, partial [Patescibacteria group bacterium]|nr:hypothetical protein [Patescibacteria group bacterium]
GNKFDKELEDELKKLEKELKDLEEGLDDIDKDGSAQPPAPALQVGTIEGNLSYPSEQIPDLTVCAEDTGGASSPYCTNSLINDLKYTAGRGYQLEVPPGDYYVYSYFIDPTYTAYYTEFVTCGMNVGCLSHNKITVTVANGDHHRNIDPVDWYMGP